MEKHIMLKFLISFLFVCGALYLSGLSYAQNSPPENWQGWAEGGWYVNVDPDDTLNIRSLPSHKSAKVGEVNRGKEVNILDSADNGWKFIETNSVSGWVNGRYLTTEILEKDTPNENSSIRSYEPLPEPSSKTSERSLIREENFSKSSKVIFETEFSKYKKIFRDNDRCFQSLKRRSELAGISMQLEQNDPAAFRSLKSKYDECVGSLNIENLEVLEKKVDSLAFTDEQKTRVHNFRNEYNEIIENAVGLLQISQLLGISLE